MQLTDYFVPLTIIASVIVLLGLAVALPWAIKANRAFEAGLLARWARENGVQVINSRRLLWMGGRTVPIGFRVTVRMCEGTTQSGILKFPWSENGYVKGILTPSAGLLDSNQSSHPAPAPGADD